MNPYKAPGAPVEDRDGEDFQLSVALIGMLIATGAAYTFGTFYGNLVQWSVHIRGVSIDDLYQTVTHSPLFNAGGHLINVFSAALGGYWAARLGPQRPVLHAAVAGAGMLLPVVGAWISPYDIPHPLWSVLLTYVTPVPSALLGALWWHRRTAAQ